MLHSPDFPGAELLPNAQWRAWASDSAPRQIAISAWQRDGYRLWRLIPLTDLPEGATVEGLELSPTALVVAVTDPRSVLNPPEGVVVGKGHACLGVDIQAALGAPAGERLRIDYSAVDDPALGLELGLLAFGLLFPVGEGQGQNMRVRHDAARAQIVLLVEPADAGRTDLVISQSSSPAV